MKHPDQRTEPLDRRALEALGKSYVEILDPYFPEIARKTPAQWKARGKVPEEYRPRVREAIERHRGKLHALLSELDKAGWWMPTAYNPDDGAPMATDRPTDAELLDQIEKAQRREDYHRETIRQIKRMDTEGAETVIDEWKIKCAQLGGRVRQLEDNTREVRRSKAYYKRELDRICSELEVERYDEILPTLRGMITGDR